jgi:hypothetical protein
MERETILTEDTRPSIERMSSDSAADRLSEEQADATPPGALYQRSSTVDQLIEERANATRPLVHCTHMPGGRN